MATQNPQIAPGTWVQYNATTQDPNIAGPDAQEQTIGLVRQAFTKSDGNYYQVIWNPGSMNPEVALYHEAQLNPLTSQAAADIRNQLAAGTYQPDSQTPGSDFQEPTLPNAALPSQLQGQGSFTATPGQVPSFTETSS